MAEIASVFQIANIGVESTPGTAVAATKRLTGLMVRPRPRVDIKKYRASGYKFAAINSLNKEWVEWDLSGVITYTEIVYLLAGLINTATPTGSVAKTWVFSPDSDGADTPKTYTVEWGDATRALEAAYGLVSALTMTFTRDGAELSGTMLSHALVDAIVLTGGVTPVALQPVMAPQVAVYLADTAANLDSAQALTRVVSAEWALSDRYSPAWFLNQSVNWPVHIEREPSLALKLKMEKDAAGMGLLTNMRAGTTKFMRIEAVGPVIDGPDTYLLEIDTACKVTGDPTFSDEEGVECVEWNMEGFHDATWGKATEITVVNALGSL